MSRNRRWDDDELSWLRDNYQPLGANECARRLGRSVGSVHQQAKRLGVTGVRTDAGQYANRGPRRAWSAEELDWLREHYRDLGPDACARHLGRSPRAVEQRAQASGVAPSRGPRRVWSDDELEWLRNNYHVLGARECARQLNRTLGAVQQQAVRLTHATVSNVGAQSPTVDRESVVAALQTLRRAMGDQQSGSDNRPWSDVEREIARLGWGLLRTTVLTSLLGRTYHAIRDQIRRKRSDTGTSKTHGDVQ